LLSGIELLEGDLAAAGDWGEAERLGHDPLDALAEAGYRTEMPQVLDSLAVVAAGLGGREDAAWLLGAADAARADLGTVRGYEVSAQVAGLAERLPDHLGHEAFAAAHAQGQELGLDEAVAWARRGRGDRGRPSHGWESLTPTELEVARHAATGLTNPQIGQRMFITAGTVKVHLSHIYAKLGISGRAELAAEVTRRGAAPAA
jgi:DNA-binding CsgD family transcriptional regulator